MINTLNYYATYLYCATFKQVKLQLSECIKIKLIAMAY